MARRISANERQDALLPYAQAVLVEAGRTLYVSGQVGIDAEGRCPPDVAGQATRALGNLGALLAAAAMDVEDIVRMTVYVTEASGVDAFRAARAAFLGEHKPASTLLIVAGLARPEWKIEIEAVAAG